jgi:hypothetical protein
LQGRLGECFAQQALRDPKRGEPLADSSGPDEQEGAGEPAASQGPPKTLEYRVMTNNGS